MTSWNRSKFSYVDGLPAPEIAAIDGPTKLRVFKKIFQKKIKHTLIKPQKD